MTTEKREKAKVPYSVLAEFYQFLKTKAFEKLGNEVNEKQEKTIRSEFTVGTVLVNSTKVFDLATRDFLIGHKEGYVAGADYVMKLLAKYAKEYEKEFEKKQKEGAAAH